MKHSKRTPKADFFDTLGAVSPKEKRRFLLACDAGCAQCPAIPSGSTAHNSILPPHTRGAKKAEMKEAAFVRATGIVRRIDDWNIIKTSQKSLKILVFADFNHDTNQHKTKDWRSAASAWERRVCSHKPIGNPRGALPRQNTAGILCAVILSKAEEANDVDGCNGQRVLSNMSRAILCGERIMRIGGRESGYVVETIPHAYSLIFCDSKMNFTLKKM